MKNIYFSSLKIRDNFSLFDIFLECSVKFTYSKVYDLPWMTVLKEEIRAQGGVVDGVRTRFQFPASHIHLLTFDH